MRFASVPLLLAALAGLVAAAPPLPAHPNASPQPGRHTLPTLPRRIPGLETFMVSRARAEAEARSHTRHPKRRGGEGSAGHAHRSAPLLPRQAHVQTHTFQQPLDHFDPDNNVTFGQRYWFTLKHYTPPTQRDPGHKLPVYLFDAGEADASEYLGYLETGILDLLANQTGGITVILEHRGFGQSYPNRSEIYPPSNKWDQDGLRFLSVEQALQDSANFIKHIKLPGVDEDLSGLHHATPFIYYGASYPGARSAWMRHNHPELVYGAIASSAVTLAQDVYPEYYYVVARGSNAYCSQAMQRAMASFDRVAKPVWALQKGEPVADPAKVKRERKALIEIFTGGAQSSLTNIQDLANTLSYPLGNFQEQYWTPGATAAWDDFCRTLTEPDTAAVKSAQRMQAMGRKAGLDLDWSLYLWGAYNDASVTGPCVRAMAPTLGDKAADYCLGTSFTEHAAAEEKVARAGVGAQAHAPAPATMNADNSWTWLTCTTFGYNMVAPGTPHPDGDVISGPKVLSELIDYTYTSGSCRDPDLFAPGKVYRLPARPDTQRVNKWGALGVAAERLAIIGGQYDPWRSVTPVSEDFAYGGDRADTLDRPFKLIPDCWHGCDSLAYSQNLTRFDSEPKRIHRIHEEALQWTGHWMRTYWAEHGKGGEGVVGAGSG